MNTIPGKMTKKSSENILTKRLKKLIKTQIEIVYVTTDNRTFLSHNDAIDNEYNLEKLRLRKQEKEKMTMKIHEILSKVLSKNEWGVFFKGEPLQHLPIQDGAKMYKVNEVNSDMLYDEIRKAVNETEHTWENTAENPKDNESSIG